MVGNEIRDLTEPEGRDLGEDLSLVRDGVIHHHVKGRDAIGGDDEQGLTQVVDVADLAPAFEGEAREVRLEQRGPHGILRRTSYHTGWTGRREIFT
jgi:hypothetical protein